MDPAAPPWQGLTTFPDWTDGSQRLEASSPSPAVRYAVRQRMTLESIAGGPGAIADLSPYALKSSTRTERSTERTKGNTKVHTDTSNPEDFMFADQHGQAWPVELSDANKITESGFLALAEPAQIRKGLANLMPKAKGGSQPGNSTRELETAQAFTAAYTTWGLDNDSILENFDPQKPIDARPSDSISISISSLTETTTSYENFAPVQPHIDISALDKESALQTFTGAGVEINQTIDWTGKRTQIQTAAFGVLTESWTPHTDGRMLYDMVLQDELRRELHSETVDATGLRTVVRTIYTDENGKKNHIVAQKVVAKSDGSQTVVMYG
jgi:hypothetical protein